MINPWFKFYGSEYLSDPKIGSLTAQERSCWLTLLCMASVASTGGVIEYLTVEVLLERSGIKFNQYHPEEWDACLSVLSKFERMNMIVKNDNGSITITNWNKRQEHVMTATERSRKYRAKIKEISDIATNATKRNENATLEENRIEKKRIDNKDINKGTPDKNVATAQVIKEFEKVDSKNKTYYGNKTQRASAKFLVDTYGIDNVIKVISILPQTNGKDYYPTITSPYELKEKWVKLASALQKEKNKEIIL